MSTEEQRTKVRELLRRDGVKLWLPPYTAEDGSARIPPEFVDKYASESGLGAEAVKQALEELRLHAVSRLVANKKFRETGVATVDLALTEPGGKKEKTGKAEIGLSSAAEDLRRRAAAVFGLHSESLKLIAAGRILEVHRPLQDQGVVHGCEVLCIRQTEEQARAEQEQRDLESVEKTRVAARRLASSEGHRLLIEDQHGNSLDLPPVEREALSVAMALHERGRAALKAGNYNRAIVFLLEADSESQQCRSEVLRAVDNYAILCLDVVWCYLKLKAVDSLPDAAARLSRCDDCFRRSYGHRFERLAVLKKGEDLRERANLVRLKLLQGVLAFHQKKYDQARSHFRQVESDIQELRVDENKLLQILSLGYTTAEAKLGLRATQGNLESAVNFILRQREERARKVKQEEEKAAQRKLEKWLGMTSNGEQIEAALYNQLVSLGFPKAVVAAVLRDAQNNLDTALELLRQQPPPLPALPQTAPDGAAAREISESAAGSDAPTSSTQGSAAEVPSAEELAEREAWEELSGDLGRDPELEDVNFEEEVDLLEEYQGLIMLHQ